MRKLIVDILLIVKLKLLQIKLKEATTAGSLQTVQPSTGIDARD